MNKDLMKQVKKNIDSCSNVDDELSKSIIVDIDKGLLERQSDISNKLIRIGFRETYKLVTETILDTAKYLKKTNLSNPFKQNIFSRFYEFPLDADYLSPPVMLYECLTDMIHDLDLFQILFDRLDEVEKEYKEMLEKSSFKNTTVFNQSALIAQMEGLKQMRLSLLALYECHRVVLKNPKVREFYKTWLEHKKQVEKNGDLEHDHHIDERHERLMDTINKM